MASPTSNPFASWKDVLLSHLSNLAFNQHTAATITAIRNSTGTKNAEALFYGANANLTFFTTAMDQINTYLIYHNCKQQGLPILGEDTKF
eukprot:11097740-Ditylum_brightwellii.AAC.1